MTRIPIDAVSEGVVDPRPRRPGVVPMLAAAGVFLLLLAGVAMVVSSEQSYREAKVQQVEAQAGLVASIVTAALAFDDRKVAQEYVDALESDPDVEAAGIYDVSGAMFAGYVRRGASPLPAIARPGPPTVDGGMLAVTRAVQQGSTILGSVYVRAIVEPITRRLERYALVGLLVLIASLIPILLGVAQARLARVNEKLRLQGVELANANRDLRSQIEQREKVETELRQAQKMEAIGQLTGGIAHDFNNLLQVIIGNLEVLLRRNLVVAADARRMLEAAARSADRASTLTQRLLAFSRRQPLAPKPVDVNKLVTGMSEILHRTLGETIRVETVFGGGLWRVFADANQLESALLNLIVNARDAMPAGGKLTIETGNVHLDEAYADANEVRPGQYVMLAVSDTGEGMSAEVLARVFEPFFTTKDVGKGSGLGLSQVYGLMKQSGGHVKIYSEPGHGTTVKLYLPRLAGADDLVDSDKDAQRPPRGARNRVVLVVEDDDDVREHTTSMLTELGYGVLAAADGASALRVLEGAGPVHLLFTDVGLPGGMNGRQLADEARLRRPSLKVLFTTGYARNAIVHQGRLDAGVELLTKPFNYLGLATKVHRMLSEEPQPL